MSSFVHLHVHSDYSPMRGVSSLTALCKAARTQGADALALTDTNGLYGAIRFIEEARRHQLRPLLGAELTHETHRALLLVKTREDGYPNLCRLLSERHAEGPFDLIAAVNRHRRGLLVLSDDADALLAWKRQSAEDLYVELTPGGFMHDALAFSRRVKIPPAATNRVHFVRPEEFALHRLLRAISLNTTLSRLKPEDCCASTHWLMPPGRMEQHYPHVPVAVQNTHRIARACHADWHFTATVFPAFEHRTHDQVFAELRRKTYQGAAQRYGIPSQEVIDRIEHELAIIRQKGYAHYFLVVDDIVRQAPRTCGRGSVAASIVSYCLAITHVDPIRHHLFFERFLNPGRKDPPDIDIDFPWDERDRIVDWTFAKYGARNAAMVANHNRLGVRAAFREVAKVYGMPPAEITAVARRLARDPASLGFDKQELDAAGLGQLGHTMKLRQPWPEIIRAAVQVQDHLRNLALHCGGLIIVPDEIRRYVPVEIAAKGLPVIQWEKDQTEEAGLVKIDILGNRSLSVIRDAIEAVKQNTGRQIDYAAWDPLHDPVTQELIRRGETIGCFYIESPATRLLLRKLWTGMPPDRRTAADVFEYLVIVSSLVRPAAISFVHDFVRRAHGTPYEPLHPTLEHILNETYGIMVYQEDVTRVAMALANFSLDDADQLRKVISKKHKQRLLRDYRRQFFEGARANGASAATIEKVWAMIMSFAGYSFCKPHSASYAQVSFKSAWLRVHHPAEFMAAVISNEGGFYSTFAYLSEARRMGLTILPPDINASNWPYGGSGRTIRVGLMQMKTLDRAFATRLLAERDENGPFRSFQDFLARVPGAPAQTRALIRAGCFDSIAGELTRPALLWRLHLSRTGSSPQRPLQGTRMTSAAPIPPEYSAEQRMRHEIESFGFPLSRHPLELHQGRLRTIPHVPAREMANHVGRRVTMIGWFITEKIVHTKHGEPMDFVSFEDLTGLYEATFFPDAYRRFCQLLDANGPCILGGVIEEAFSTVALTVQHVELLNA